MKKKVQYKKKSAKAAIIGGIILAALIAVGGATYYFTRDGNFPGSSKPSETITKASLEEMNAVLAGDTIYKGIYINGIDVSGKTVEEVMSMFAEDPGMHNQEIDIKLSVDGIEHPLDTAGLKLESNIGEIAEEAYLYGRASEGSTEDEILKARYEAVMALQTTPKYFQTAITLSKDKVSELVHDVLDPMVTETKDASVTGFDVENKVFVFEDSQEGVTLGIEEAITRVKASLDNGEYVKTIAVSRSVQQPEVTREFLSSQLGLISSTTTSTKSDKNRNINIRLVCETVNGLLLKPGEYFNYNEFVGERTTAKGYKEAGGIYDGVLRDELGGGICQVSGTMYHSVMKADLQVDERHPHSWPSGYVAVGTDATVTWGGANFQFTNNTDYPIVMVAEYKPKDNGDGGWCKVEIYGRPIPDGMTIEFVGVIHSSKAPTTTEWVADPTQKVGITTTERGPHNAISASAYQVFYRDGVEVKRVKASTSYYRLIPAKILVGVLDEDGVTVHSIDPLTGAVIFNTPTVTPTPTGEPPVTTPPATTPPATTPPETTASGG